MPNDIAVVAEQLVELCEDEYGSTPRLVKVSPAGEVEVNVQVWFRGEGLPHVHMTPRRPAGKSKQK